MDQCARAVGRPPGRHDRCWPEIGWCADARPVPRSALRADTQTKMITLTRRAWAFGSLLSGQDRMFEDDPAESEAVRQEHCRQLTDFIGRYVAKRPQRPKGRALREKIGYPFPGLTRATDARSTVLGEDQRAKWHRLRVRIDNRLWSYGLWAVPTERATPTPLLISPFGFFSPRAPRVAENPPRSLGYVPADDWRGRMDEALRQQWPIR